DFGSWRVLPSSDQIALLLIPAIVLWRRDRATDDFEKDRASQCCGCSQARRLHRRRSPVSSVLRPPGGEAGSASRIPARPYCDMATAYSCGDSVSCCASFLSTASARAVLTSS